jgi:putative phosphoesterase
MKIACISDIHTDINSKYDIVNLLSVYLRKNNADILLIAGDIYEDFSACIKTVKRIEELSGIKVFYVPGNHDLWNKNTVLKSCDDIYEQYVNDYHCLSGTLDGRKKGIILHGTYSDYMLIGDTMWYDYSFADPAYTKAMLDSMEHDGRTWQDKFYNSWTLDNTGRCSKMLGMLETRLKSIHNYRVIVMTHMIPVPEFDVPKSYKGWGFFNGYLGSRKIQGILEKERNVDYCICGHVHFRKKLDKNNIHYILPCLNYHTEWVPEPDGHIDAEHQIRESTVFFNI